MDLRFTFSKLFIHILLIPVFKEKIAGGILLLDSATEKPQIVEVVEVGDGKRNDDGSRIPIEVKVADKVLYSK